MFRAKVSGQFSTVYRTDIFVVELDEENWDDLVSTGPTSEGDIVEVGLGLETQRKREREKKRKRKRNRDSVDVITWKKFQSGGLGRSRC
ncbi:hypothetical protein V1478_017735 [Vespula squamosa]|uniref:Uncharacterized protein n=1 Tax=Vespula squamosa TaxID=30214 RepID=A0ABD1ZZ11_VESSQ